MNLRSSRRASLERLGPLVLAALAALATGACSGDADPPATPGGPTPGTPDAATEVDGGPPGDGGGLPPAAPFTIVREPGAACEAMTTAKPVSLATSLQLTGLQALGPRRLARALTGDGFVTFDADGAGGVGAPIAVGTATHAAASDTGVLAAGTSGTKVVASRFTPSGAPVQSGTGTELVLGDARSGPEVAVGRSGDVGVVAWAASRDTVRARGVDAAGALGPELALESGAEYTDFTAAIAPSAAGDGSEFIVLWSVRRSALAAYRVYAALVRHGGIVGLPRVVFGTDAAVRLVSVVMGPGGGALLANLDGEPLVAPIDTLGRLRGPTHLFEGSRDTILGGGLGLALRGEELGLVADHLSGAHVFRRLDGLARPQEGWVCLDAPAAGTFQLGSIMPDGAGWTTLVMSPTGSQLLRIDATGTAAP